MLCQLSYRRESSLSAARRTTQLVVLDGLHLKELLEAVVAELAPDARLLVSAKWRDHVEGAAIDLHLTGANLARDLEGLLVGVCRDANREPVVGVVGASDGLVLGVVGDDR